MIQIPGRNTFLESLRRGDTAMSAIICRRGILMLLVAAMVFVAVAATAGETAWTGRLHVGYAAYKMESINDSIKIANSIAGGDFLDEIHGGLQYGAELGGRVTPSLVLGVGYTRLNGNSSFTGPGGTVEIDVPANLWEGFFNWLIPRPGQTVFGFGGSVGVVATNTEISSTPIGEPNETVDATGSSLAVSVFALVDIPLGQVGLQIQAGYRMAKISDLEGTAVDSRDSLDYTGVFVRGAVRFGS